MEGIQLIPAELTKLIPIFDGDKRELNLFLRKCEYIIGMYIGNEAQNLYIYHAITSRLAGNAAALLSEREDVMSWTNLRELLIQHFGEQRNEQCLAIELETIKIKQGESFLEFCNRVQSIRSMLLAKVNESNDENIRASKLIIYNNLSLNVFLYNLPEHLVRIVRLKNPTTLENALSIVLEEVNFEEQYRLRSKIINSNISKPFGGNNASGSKPFNLGNSPANNFSNNISNRNVPQYFGNSPNRQGQFFNQNRFVGQRPQNSANFGNRPPQFYNQQAQQQLNNRPGYAYRPQQLGNRPQQFGYNRPQQFYGFRPPQFGQRPQVQNGFDRQVRQEQAPDVSMRTVNRNNAQINELYCNAQTDELSHEIGLDYNYNCDYQPDEEEYYPMCEPMSYPSFQPEPTPENVKVNASNFQIEASNEATLK